MSMSTAEQKTTYHLIPPGTSIEENGEGEALELGALAGKRAVVVLRLDEIIEQESLRVSVWGSADGQVWGEKALFAYPQKFYRGATPAMLDLSQKPEIRFLRARWEVNRWGRGYPRPFFQVSVEVQEL